MTARYAQVIVDIAHFNVDTVYSYLIPDGLTVQVGHRVLVPFGHQKKEGYVLSLSDSTDVPPDKLRQVIDTLDDEPVLLPHMLKLADALAQSAHCPKAECLRLLIPADMRGGRVKVKTETMARLLVTPAEAQQAAEADKRSHKRRFLLQLLQDGRDWPVSELSNLVRTPLDNLRQLADKGLVTLFEREVLRRPMAGAAGKETAPPLTDSQLEVLEVLLPALRKGTGRFLLHGVTGSGKTEVYIRAVEECLAQGKTALILVPEIVLTPQMVRWFRGRLGENTAVMHSGLSKGERYDEWRRTLRGDARVVIGARSAIFAPLSRLGLIVVDEEHEGSYLSDRTPVYDARELAEKRCDNEGATLLLASATPSVLSFAKASRGDLTLVEMPHRVNGRPMPQVYVIDMREELRLGNKGMLSELLHDKLRQCIDKGQQAMLFLNRRGYASSVTCRACGHTVSCTQCDISLTYHQATGQMHCHYCGQRQPYPAVCPACGSPHIRTLGVGTQKVEEEIKRLFPGVSTLRMDIDTTRGKDGHAKILNRFRAGEAQVMVGTQMITKGLDFPQVTLVGALLADMSLNLPDYRSAERTFQLLTQVAGRAGRADQAGEVVIQTYKPDHYAIAAAAQQDYRRFFTEEFKRRRRDLYPPFTMMLRLLCEDMDEAKARVASEAVRDRVKDYLSANETAKKRVFFLRQDASPLTRLMGMYRYQVTLKVLDHPDARPLIGFLRELADEEWPVRLSFEINPASLA